MYASCVFQWYTGNIWYTLNIEHTLSPNICIRSKNNFVHLLSPSLKKLLTYYVMKSLRHHRIPYGFLEFYRRVTNNSKPNYTTHVQVRL